MSGKITKMLKVLLFSYIVTAVLLLLMALILYKLKVTDSVIKNSIYAIYSVSVFAGALVMGKLTKEKRMIWGLVIALLYFAVLSVVSFGVSKTFYREVSEALRAFVCCIFGGIIGSMVS